MQTSYSLNADQAVLGMTSEDFQKYVQTVFPSLAVAPGRLVVCDATASKPSNYAKYPTTYAEALKAIGVTMQDFTREGGVDYSANKPVPAVRKGRIWVAAEGAITRWSPLFGRFATGSGTALGAFRANEDSGTCAPLEGAIALTDAADGELFLAEFNLLGGRAAKSETLNLGALSSKASDAAVLWGIAPVTGYIKLFQSVLLAALATGDATFQLLAGANVAGLANVGSTTTGLITATQASSAAGDVDSAAPLTTNVFVKKGDLIKVVAGGASTATATAAVAVTIEY